MKQLRRQALEQQTETLPNEVRRSTRTHRPPKNDDYLMGTQHIEELLGPAYYEEDCYPKRRRKNHRYDDSDDYSDGHRYTKKSTQFNNNKVEGLLEWKKNPSILPITVNYLPEKDYFVPIEELHKVKHSKHISTQNLSSVAEDIQAIFINIDWGKKGQTLKDFQQLKLQSNKLMSKGLVFVWAPKECITELLQIMEKKDFVYVENFEIIKMDIRKAIAEAEKVAKMKFQENITDIWPIINCLEQTNPCDLIADQPSEYFNKSKQTLLMFKKNNNAKFELRHQRTCDVVFDMPLKLGQKCAPDIKAYIYNMIETLLPDCLNIFQKNKTDFGYKMLELWADKDEPRRGWVSLIQD